jgi:protein phosphatase
LWLLDIAVLVRHQHHHWQSIDKHTDLQVWLKQLRKQIYASEGRAYDNATAILVKFDEH